MTVTTNCEIGDKVIFSVNSTFVGGIIDDIIITINKDKKITFDYKIAYNSLFYVRSEDQIFKNADEFAKRFNL